jgi:nitrogen regulatory protein PII
MAHVPNSAEQYEKMIGTPIPQLVSSLAIPTTISMLVTVIYNTADTYFVSQINKSASAAVGMVYTLMAILQAVGYGLGMGAGSLISRKLGISMQEEEEFVVIVTPREKKAAVMNAISDACGLRTDAHGIIVSLPVDEVIGLETGENTL